MATYVPTLLRTPTALTASSVAVYTPSGATTGIMRTYGFVTETAHSVFLSIGADGTGTRLEDTTLLTINIPLQRNGFWVIPNAVNLNAHADSVATNAPNFYASGYEYS